MDKALQIGKSSATGSFHLLIGVVGSTVIMAIGTLIIAGLLPASQVGLYGIAMIPATLIGFFRDWGVNSALTQQIASLKAQGKDQEIHDVIYSGIIFEVITGAILSAICFALASPLAYILSPQNANNLTIYIAIMSFSIFASALINASSGIFVGFEKMKLNSLNQIAQAIVKTALGPFLIVIGFGVLGAIYAVLVSLIAGALIGIALVYFALYRTLHNTKLGKHNIKKTLKPMLSYGLPLTISTLTAGVLVQIFAFTMALYAGTEVMGNYYVAAYFSTILTFISFPVSTMLFPVFSKISPQQEPELLKTVFSSSVKYTSMLLVPATLLLITLSTPLINTLFPQQGILNSLFTVNPTAKYPFAPLFLSLSIIVNLLVLFGNITVGAFQNGIKQTKQAMKQSIAGFIVGIPLAFLLVAYFYTIGGPSYAIIGGLIGSLIAEIPSVTWGLYWSWKNYKVKANFAISGKILASSTLASVLTYLLITIFKAPYVVLLFGGALLFAVIYLTSAVLTGAISRVDIDNFRTMFSGLGQLSRILDFPLLILQKMTELINKEKALPPTN